MGIQNFNKFLEKKVPNAFFKLPISELSGKRIAIDANGWMYANMKVARKKVVAVTNITKEQLNEKEVKKQWYLMLIDFILTWQSQNITPIWVFDGEYPAEKADEQKKRSDSKKATKAKIETLYEQLNNGNQTVINDLRKNLINYIKFTSEDFDSLKSVLTNVGVPVLQAKGEGEKLCSMLCIDGKVAGVWTTDTDALIYGCPLIINRFTAKNQKRTVDCVRLDQILIGLNMSPHTFVDLGIMSGCDYNTNMEDIAVARSYKLLQQYHFIEFLPRNYDIQCLNHHRCRTLFEYHPFSELIVKHEDNTEIKYDCDKNAIVEARDLFDLIGISNEIERIISVMKWTTKSQDGYVDSLNLISIPKYILPKPAIKLIIS